MKKIIYLLLIIFASLNSFSQMALPDSMLIMKDSAFKAMIKADSLKLEKQFADAAHWAKIEASVLYPAIKNGGKYSGIIPVENPTEIPDPKMDYKLLFELTSNNPDSVIMEINYGLTEATRIINLHAASGIPINKIMPVLVVHAGALAAISNNAYYQKHYKTDNPNIKLLAELEKMGARIIACGQAMAFKDIHKEDLLPEVKVSLTAQTVLSSYQLKGYVWYDLNMDKR